jgi:uncharacterized protein (DUF1501 family)
MLTIFSKQNRAGYCDRMKRRDFIRVGGLAMGGLALPHLLQHEAHAGSGRSHKALINIFLPGGPSHMDMFDLKPEAPAEIRGEFRPIKTNVKGIEICELFPRLARQMDKWALIRTLSDSAGQHNAYQCMTGRRPGGREPAGGWPSAGGWVSKKLGPVKPSIPANISLMYQTGNRGWGEAQGGGFLGKAHNPFQLVGGKGKMGKPDNLVLKGISLERLNDRAQLLQSVDNFRRAADTTGEMTGLDAYYQQAMGILSSNNLFNALDLSKEDPRVLARYGGNNPAFQRDGAPKMVRNFCVARRLVEAGARVVTVNYSRWDWHGGDGMNYPRSRQEFPLLDMGLSSLMEDLHDRGMEKDVSVVVWGEFGRTPKINKNNSRDHWPRVTWALMGGGAMRTGQVIGKTTRYGEEPADRPVKFQEVFATLYHNMRLGRSKVRLFDLQGRPQSLVDPGIMPMRELI